VKGRFWRKRPFMAAVRAISVKMSLLRNAAWIALHENIMVAVTVAIAAFVFRPRQLIGYDRLRSQPA
jgi:hypothetical protein